MEVSDTFIKPQKKAFAYALNDGEYRCLIRYAPGDRVTRWDDLMEELF